MRILVASSNPHKLDEINAIFHQCAHAAPEQSVQAGSEGADHRGAHIDLLNLAALAQTIPEPIEDQLTFEGNAALKARYYAAATDMLCLADDSGLEVDALNGAPGVRSARYADTTGPREVVDLANNRLLMQNLRDVPIEKRTARFICAMALAAPTSSEQTQILVAVRGTIEGRILTDSEAGPDAAGRGDHGFGYDPLFFVADLGKTTAQLSAEHKNSISHRGSAARQLWEEIAQL